MKPLVICWTVNVVKLNKSTVVLFRLKVFKTDFHSHWIVLASFLAVHLRKLLRFTLANVD